MYTGLNIAVEFSRCCSSFSSKSFPEDRARDSDEDRLTAGLQIKCLSSDCWLFAVTPAPGEEWCIWRRGRRKQPSLPMHSRLLQEPFLLEARQTAAGIFPLHIGAWRPQMTAPHPPAMSSGHTWPCSPLGLSLPILLLCPDAACTNSRAFQIRTDNPWAGPQLSPVTEAGTNVPRPVPCL